MLGEFKNVEILVPMTAQEVETLILFSEGNIGPSHVSSHVSTRHAVAQRSPAV